MHAARHLAAGGVREGRGAGRCRDGRAGGVVLGGHEGEGWGGHRQRPETGGAIGYTPVRALAMPTSASGWLSHPKAQKEEVNVSSGAKFRTLQLCSCEVLLI